VERTSTLLAFITLITVIAPANAATNPLEKVTAVASPRTVVLDQPIRGTVERIKSEYVLSAGSYKAIGENTLGTMYEAPGGIIYAIRDGYMLRTGGIWVPRNQDEKLRIYGYFDKGWSTHKTLADALSAQAAIASRAVQDKQFFPKGELDPIPAITTGAAPTASAAQAGAAAGIGAAIIHGFIALEHGKAGPIFEITTEAAVTAFRKGGAAVK
jgi:hypothetical protein